MAGPCNSGEAGEGKVKCETLTFCGRIVFCCSGVLCLTLFSRPVQAEMYVAGQVGVSIPNSFSNIEGVDSNAGLTVSDLSLQNSVIYGAKLGYYFDSMKWLGVETEVFNSTPHIKQQDAAIGVPGFSGTVNLAGTSLRVLNWASVNVVVRYQMGQFEPYAGVGMGVFFANVTEAVNGESSSGTTVGLNTRLGLRYLVTKNMSCLANGNIAVPALTSRHQAPRKQPEELKETTAPTFWPSASATTANRS